MARKKKYSIDAEDLYKLETVNGCSISPDGSQVAYSLQRVDRKSEKKFSNIWMAPTSGGKPRQFTYGDQNDHTPRWSPDGKSIAFLSSRKSEKQFQLFSIPVDGGEASPLTDLKGSFSSFEWSPDGTKMVICFRKKDTEELEREKEKQKKELGIVYRHFDRVFFKSDGAGFIPKERFHIHLLDVRKGKIDQITDGEHDELEPTWSPDGGSVLYISNRSPDPGLDYYRGDIYIYDLKESSERALELPEGNKSFPRFSPDGRHITYTGDLEPGKWWKKTEILMVAADGSNDPAVLTDGKDATVGNLTLNDVQGHPPSVAPLWDPNGSMIYFQTSEEGTTKLVYIDLEEEGRPFHYLVDEDAAVGEFSMDSTGGHIAFQRTDLMDPGNIWVIDMDRERWRRITDHNSRLRKATSGFHIEERWMEDDGGDKVQGWIMHPPGFKKDGSYPSVLEIHGGPRAQYGFTFMHEFYFLASKGFVVHFCNPRGSQGYGEDFAGSIWKKWGTVDFNDVMNWSDEISRLPYIDKERMFVTGGSYGGYMTNLIIGRSRMFRAAVTQRSVSNLISMWGSSDVNWIFQEEFTGVPPWQDLERYWEQSPMKFIKDAVTPTLVIHSENDLRCSIEQGEQIYVALKKLGIDTELLRFPDEPHGLSRMGRTDRRIVRLEHIHAWFEKYMNR